MTNGFSNSAIVIMQGGGMGDAVMALPLVNLLKRKFDTIKIFANQPEVFKLPTEESVEEKNAKIEIVRIPDFPSLSFKERIINYFKLLKSIDSHSKIFILAPSRYNILFKIFAKNDVYGFQKILDKVYIDLKSFKILNLSHKPAFEIRQLGINMPDWRYPQIKLDENILCEIKRKVGIDLSNKKIILINPYVKDKYRNLSLDFYFKLIQNLKKIKNIEVILCGGKDAVAICQQLSNECKVSNLAGQFNVYEFLHLLKLSKIFITPDTGPMHLSFLVGNVRTVCFFTVVRPEYRIPDYLIYEKKVIPIYVPEVVNYKINTSSLYTKSDLKLIQNFYKFYEKNQKDVEEKILDKIFNEVKKSISENREDVNTCAE